MLSKIQNVLSVFFNTNNLSKIIINIIVYGVAFTLASDRSAIRIIIFLLCIIEMLYLLISKKIDFKGFVFLLFCTLTYMYITRPIYQINTLHVRGFDSKYSDINLFIGLWSFLYATYVNSAYYTIDLILPLINDKKKIIMKYSVLFILFCLSVLYSQNKISFVLRLGSIAGIELLALFKTRYNLDVTSKMFLSAGGIFDKASAMIGASVMYYCMGYVK